MPISKISGVALVVVLAFAGHTHAAEGKSSKNVATKVTAGSLLEYKPIFENSTFNWNHFYLNAAVGSNLRPSASVDLNLGFGYEWLYSSAGLGLHMKSGAFGAIRAVGNNNGSLPDPTLYSQELARARADADSWALMLMNLNFGVHGPLLFSFSQRVYQKATCALELGRATDSTNSLQFSLFGLNMGAFLGYQISKQLAVEFGLDYHWLDATRSGDEVMESRKLPLHWLETRAGVQFYF